MESRLTLLTVHAHPDDGTISTGGTMARYAAEGLRIVCVTGTGGELGEIVVPEMDTPENHARLADIRRVELDRALAHLGPIEHHFLGYRDSDMMGRAGNVAPESFWQADLDEAVERLMSIVRAVRPQVVVSYNDFGGYGHPDHIRVAQVAKAAFERAALEPDPPLKLYETTSSNRRRDEVRARAVERGVPPWWDPSAAATDEERREREEHLAAMSAAQGPVTTVIDVAPWIAAKHAAMREHVTQLAADGFFLALTPDDWCELMPTEDYTLRVSRVGVRLPEDDLFAGLR